MRILATLLMLIFSCFFPAQNQEVIQLRGDVTNMDHFRPVNSLVFIDGRTDKHIGRQHFGAPSSLKEIVFKDDIAQQFSKWYKIYNSQEKMNGEELYFVMKKLQVTSEPADSGNEATVVDFYAATFRKKDGKFFLAAKKDTVIKATVKRNVGELTMQIIPALTADLVNRSFKADLWERTFDEAELNQFHEIMMNENKSVQQQLKEGIYPDFYSFFMQTPLQGTLVRNRRNEVVGAKNTANKNFRSIFAYVENAKAYKNTWYRYLPMEQNSQNQYYIMASRNQLFPDQNNSYMMYGALGALMGSIITDIKDRKQQRNVMMEVVIDPITGEYDFPDTK